MPDPKPGALPLGDAPARGEMFLTRKEILSQYLHCTFGVHFRFPLSCKGSATVPAPVRKTGFPAHGDYPFPVYLSGRRTYSRRVSTGSPPSCRGHSGFCTGISSMNGIAGDPGLRHRNHGPDDYINPVIRLQTRRHGGNPTIVKQVHQQGFIGIFPVMPQGNFGNAQVFLRRYTARRAAAGRTSYRVVFLHRLHSAKYA